MAMIASTCGAQRIPVGVFAVRQEAIARVFVFVGCPRWALPMSFQPPPCPPPSLRAFHSPPRNDTSWTLGLPCGEGEGVGSTVQAWLRHPSDGANRSQLPLTARGP